MKLRAKRTTKSDVYSLALVMWEIGSRKIPYEGEDNATIKEEVKSGEQELLEEFSMPYSYK